MWVREFKSLVGVHRVTTCHSEPRRVRVAFRVSTRSRDWTRQRGLTRERDSRGGFSVSWFLCDATLKFLSVELGGRGRNFSRQSLVVGRQ